ncbi:MAG: hypothetical protein IT160_15655 [Bryobacterales bacterium]|nr:hypothetical protein [Bryobacterales bacterium]
MKTLSRRAVLQSMATGAAAGSRRTPVRRKIDSLNPLFVVEGGMPMWTLLSGEFRSHCALMIHAGVDERALFTELEKYQRAAVPVIISVQGDEADTIRTPLRMIARAFDSFPALIGCRACELSCGPGMTSTERRNLIDLIRLCGSKRGLIHWQDMGYPYQREHIFMQAGREPELFRALSENGDCVILAEKNNGWGKYHQTRSLAMGMWASGVVANWGLNAEDWWWYEQGYGKRFAPSRGRRGWARQLAAGAAVTGNWEYASAVSSPDILYAQNAMCAAAGGATVFSFESMHAYCHQDREGKYRLTPAWRNAIYPLLRTLLDNRLIPSREQVVERARVAWADSGEEGTELDGTGEALYRPLYGALEPDSEILAAKLSRSLLPRTGRYYYLPVIPKLANAAARARFAHIIHPHQFASGAAERTYFDRLNPAESSGTALAFHINHAWYVTNPHENEAIATNFSCPVSIGSARAQLSGVLEPHSLLIGFERGGQLRLLANNYLVNTHIWDEPRPAVFDGEAYLRNYVSNPDDKQWRATKLEVTSAEHVRPGLRYHTERGTVRSNWSRDTGKLAIDLVHNGPVWLELTP